MAKSNGRPSAQHGTPAIGKSGTFGSFVPVKGLRVYEQIALQIEHAILEHRLHRGDKLPTERDLATQLGVSRVSVREALRMLQLKGLLLVKKGPTGGAFVRRQADSALLRDGLRSLAIMGEFSTSHMSEVRLAIEPEVARVAALRSSANDHQALAKTLQNGSPADAADKTRDVGLDLDFHSALAIASKNPVFSLLLHTIMEIEADLVIPTHRFSHIDHCSVDKSHQEIYDAILAGDGDRAADAMRWHLLDIQERKLKGKVDSNALSVDTESTSGPEQVPGARKRKRPDAQTKGRPKADGGTRLGKATQARGRN